MKETEPLKIRLATSIKLHAIIEIHLHPS